MTSKKTILVSCRVDEFPDRAETRDALDQRVSSLVIEAGALAVLVPNVPEMAAEIFAKLRPDGILLSGGNDLGQRPERDQTETALLRAALASSTRVFGICRGFQMMTDFLGGSLKPVQNHVRVRHKLVLEGGGFGPEVNSYHSFAPDQLPSGWKILGKAEDHVIEWACSEDLLWQGILWHPERETKTSIEDLRIFREHFRI